MKTESRIEKFLKEKIPFYIVNGNFLVLLLMSLGLLVLGLQKFEITETFKIISVKDIDDNTICITTNKNSSFSRKEGVKILQIKSREETLNIDFNKVTIVITNDYSHKRSYIIIKNMPKNNSKFKLINATEVNILNTSVTIYDII